MRYLRDEKFFIFLTATFLVANLIYWSGRAVSLSLALFLVINIGNAHYLAAFTYGFKAWKDFAFADILKKLLLLALAAIGYWLIFYYSRLGFGWAILSILIMAIFHIVRDYPVFYFGLISDVRAQTRNIYGTLFLGAFYFLGLFAYFYLQPHKVHLFFLQNMPESLFLYGSLAMGITAVCAGIRWARSGHANLVTVFAAGGLILAIAVAAVYFDPHPADLVYIVVLWHFTMWLAYTLFKKKSVVNRIGHKEQKISYMDSIHGFIVILVVIHATIFIGAFGAIYAGYWQNIDDMAFDSIIWGLYGYPLWSFSHIAFSAIPRPRKIL